MVKDKKNFYPCDNDTLVFDVNKEVNEIRFNQYLMQKENIQRIKKKLPRGQFYFTFRTAATDLNLSLGIIRGLVKKFVDLNIIVNIYIPPKGSTKPQIFAYNTVFFNTEDNTDSNTDYNIEEHSKINVLSDTVNTDNSIEESTDINTSKKEYIKREYKKNIYSDIFNLYLEQGIIKHKELTGTMKKAIDKANKRFSIDEIKLAITRYGAMYRDKENNYAIKYCKYKWTLQELLTREKGISEFLDEGGKWIRYTDNQQANNNEDMKVIEAYESLEYLKGGISFE